MEEFKKKAEDAVKTLQRYLKMEDGWTVAKKTKDGAIISYRPSPEEGFEGYLYKGESIINAPPATVFKYVDPLPDGPRAKWDSNMKKIEVLKWIETPGIRINRACTASACMGLISPRDFVDVICTLETEESFSTNAASCVYSECPEEKKYVRGKNYPCGLVCQKIAGEPNKTKMISLIQPDIGGMLPRALVDGAIPSSMCAFFSELKEALEKDGKTCTGMLSISDNGNFVINVIQQRIKFKLREPNKTKMISLIQPDIGGMLPRALVDGAIPSSMCAFFSELKEALKADGKTES